MQSLIITQPDDWHVHLRDGDMLKDTVAASARHFGRILAMPNLKPALTTVASLQQYRERIYATLPAQHALDVRLTLFLNHEVTPDTLMAAKAHPWIAGAKFYPLGATTHSDEGASGLRPLYPLLECMQSLDLVLQLHGEVTHGDIFMRERHFVESVLTPLVSDFPKLRIVLEHVSTKAAVEFVESAPDTVAATITPHHLLYNRNHLLAGGIRPHYYCLPILKSAGNQQTLMRAATSGNPKFFAGTDSAPHAVETKESACGCAGIYSAPYALSLYAEAFADSDKLERLEGFMSQFGADFYKVPPNSRALELRREPSVVPATLSLGTHQVVPMRAGETLAWSVYESA